MQQVNKKKQKLIDRLAALEADLRSALQKKSSSAAEIDVPGKTRQIQELRADRRALRHHEQRIPNQIPYEH